MASSEDKSAPEDKPRPEDEPRPEGKKPCQLLQLPAKVRERIWEEAVCGSENVNMDLDTIRRRAHGWMRSSKQVFSETFPLWLRRTQFICEMSDENDFINLLGVENIFKRYTDTAEINVRVIVNPEFRIDAEILTMWVEHVHYGGNWRPTMELSGTGAAIFLACLLEQAFLSRAMSLEDFKKVVMVWSREFSLMARMLCGISDS